MMHVRNLRKRSGSGAAVTETRAKTSIEEASSVFRLHYGISCEHVIRTMGMESDSWQRGESMLLLSSCHSVDSPYYTHSVNEEQRIFSTDTLTYAGIDLSIWLESSCE